MHIYTKVRKVTCYYAFISYLSTHRCQNDVINAWFRIECRILVFLRLLPNEITRFIQSIESQSITSEALLLGVGTQSAPGSVAFIGIIRCASLALTYILLQQMDFAVVT